LSTSIATSDLDLVLFQKLAPGNRATLEEYPVGSGARQPVHTVYGGAHIFKAAGARKLGDIALRSLEQYGGGPVEFCRAAGLTEDSALAERVYARILEKLKREPVEDFRIDFEDGYGNRSDEEEDGHAISSAGEVVKGLADGTLPPFIGIRIKPLSDELCRRSIRSLDLFVTAVVNGAGKLPPNFVVTLPKITNTAQVDTLHHVMGALESKLALQPGELQMEFMVETPQSIIGPDGACHLPTLLAAAKGRCRGAHFGTYDYTALCDITAEYQAMPHAVCDFAKHMMQVSLLNRDIMLSDGATNVMPVARFRAAKDGPALTSAQEKVNMQGVRDGWRLHADHIRHSLVNGYYQGWDLHPAQLPTRYGAVYSFFLKSYDSAAERLKNFVEQAAKATLVGDVFDDAATGQGLLNYFLRGMNCGAFSEAEATSTGLSMAEFQTRSFVQILEGRKQ